MSYDGPMILLGQSTGVVFPSYVGEKLQPAFIKKTAGKAYVKAIPRGVGVGRRCPPCHRHALSTLVF